MPVALVAAIADSLRLVELAGGPLLLPANRRITASPAPVVAHITNGLLTKIRDTGVILISVEVIDPLTVEITGKG